MPVAHAIRESMQKASWIRKMFEEGLKLKKEFGAENVFDFSLGNPDLEPPEAFNETLLRIINSKQKGMHAYMPNAGYPEVRAAIAKKVSKEHAFKIDADHIVMTVGAAGGLNIVLKTFLNPADEVIVIAPYFAEYGFYIKNHQGIMKVVKAKEDFSLDIEQIEKALSPKTAAILINSPNNPSGKIYKREELLELAKVLKAHGEAQGRFPLLIADEPYRDIYYDGKIVPPILDLYSETIVVSSYSKSLSLPGERIGYVAVSHNCIEDLEVIQGLILSNRTLGFVNAPALMQKVVAELTELTTDMSSYARRRNSLSKVLKDAGIQFSEPEGAFYIFCKVPKGKSPSDVDFCMHLKNHNILAVPGEGFGCSGFFRLCYACPDSTIEKSANAFNEAVSAWKK